MPDAPASPSPVPPLGAVLVVGAGRMGTALAAALREAGVEVEGPAGRGATGEHADIVLLAVPDAEIATAAVGVATGRLVGHLSGATTLEPLAPHEAFSIHPLMTVTGPRVAFGGVPAAIAASTARARAAAVALAAALGLQGVDVEDDDRAAYHAAASIASNFLMAVEGFAEQVAATAGLDRAALVPLVRAAVENWAAEGAAAALTGPIARRDDETVARQRAAVAERLPERLALFDALAEATRELATTETSGPAAEPRASRSAPASPAASAPAPVSPSAAPSASAPAPVSPSAAPSASAPAPAPHAVRAAPPTAALASSAPAPAPPAAASSASAPAPAPPSAAPSASAPAPAPAAAAASVTPALHAKGTA
ncbi:putative short-subunit dehydrogenase-like oxidoreductase (DUF2520 family) [Microbacterium ulmi]|nr:Rossmann-like and DUF2520 domain-containing protein [Microbacterium ulmi]NII68609.1 putative short-subunit dehydrogenase-like oxidoreductase (DUF2520 family) [Microbacterium ulmi]